MDERHVPPVGLRYWLLFLITSVFGSHMGDAVRSLVSSGLLCQILVLAGFLSLVFVIERRDRRASDIHYWSAVIIVQMMAVRLADFSVIQLHINRIELVIGLMVLLAATLVMSRSDETRIFSRLQLERPAADARPMADFPHWMGLLIASVAGSVAADLFAITFHLGAAGSALAISVVAIVLVYLQWPTRRGRLHAFWITTTLVRADGIAIADVLVKKSYLHLGLALGTVLSGLVVIGLLLSWRPPKSLI
ncbi:Uncharacterized membrane-anchored protein [Enhydrobacter aerosaccus]|uniref:Uncharacterized membrane-anchored protein n=1 Tax=Enhydrobacter aerosaccus TaxID=225324 RepID=A0A1T4JNI6_9HYPH|nr:hypothetical protein [Enhydrobacter aerosaccus]SJZ31730.1 Uncharacterized membrane-anchored protein [Enhydrobacter aerosaccus]